MRLHPRIGALLHRALGHELAAAQQCVLAAAQAEALSLHQLAADFRTAARDELLHAEAFALHIARTGTPVRTPAIAASQVGETEDQLLRAGLIVEREAVALYERAVPICDECHDPAAKELFARILAEERQHLRDFEAQQPGVTTASGPRIAAERWRRPGTLHGGRGHGERA